MRVSVASTGGGTGSASAGNAARRRARYSFTGSTTQPSVLEPVVWARPAVVAKTIKKAGQSALMATPVTPRIAGPLTVVERAENTARWFERTRHEANMPSRFIVFLLRFMLEIQWRRDLDRR